MAVATKPRFSSAESTVRMASSTRGPSSAVRQSSRDVLRITRMFLTRASRRGRERNRKLRKSVLPDIAPLLASQRLKSACRFCAQSLRARQLRAKQCSNTVWHDFMSSATDRPSWSMSLKAPEDGRVCRRFWTAYRGKHNVVFKDNEGKRETGVEVANQVQGY
jgi:hypothetical protein